MEDMKMERPAIGEAVRPELGSFWVDFRVTDGQWGEPHAGDWRRENAEGRAERIVAEQ